MRSRETLHERNLLDVLDAALDHIDEPLADPSFLPTFLLSRLAARHVKVVVGGDGGDELWGGYPTYRAHGIAAVYRAVPGWIRKQRHRRRRRAAADRRSLPEPGVEAAPVHQALGRRHGDAPPALDVERRPARSGAGDPGGEGDVARRRSRRRCPRRDDSLQRILALDFSTYMPGSVLTKVDRASMAHGLEVRPPLLDDAMLELVVRAAVALQGAARLGQVPAQARGARQDPRRDHRPPQEGVRDPAGELAARSAQGPDHEVVARSPVFDRGILDGEVFRGWNDQHQAKRADHSKPLWALLVLDHWFRRNLGPLSAHG